MNLNYNKSRIQKNLDDYNYNIDPYGNNYSGVHILPRWREDDIKKKRDEEIDKYKEIWSKEIEERKIKKLEEIRKKEQMDILEEERIKKEIDELNKRQEREKQIQKEKENTVFKENEQLIKNKFIIKKQNKTEENGLTNEYNNLNNIKTNKDKTSLVKSESFNYMESLDKLRSKYKDVDLNNIQFYKQRGKELENRKIIEKKLSF